MFLPSPNRTESTNVNATARSPTNWWKRSLVSSAVCSAILLVLIVVWRLYAGGAAAADAAIDGNTPSNGGPAQALSEVERQELEIRRKELEISRSRVNAKVASLKSRGTELRNLLAKLEADSKAYQAKSQALLDSIEGKRIVGSGSYLDVVEPLLISPPVSTAKIGGLRNQVDELLRPIQSGDVDTTLESLQTISDDLEAVALAIQPDLDRLQRDDELLSHVLRDTAYKPPANQTLREAIGTRQTERLKLRAEQVAAAAREAEETATKLLQDEETRRIEAKAELDRQAIEKERQTLEQQAGRMKQQADAEAAAFAAEQAKAKLRAELTREMSQVRSMLMPFISDGSTQLGPRGLQVTTKSGPLSLSGLQSHGALADTIPGRRILHLYGGSPENGRPTGAFPTPFFDNLVYKDEATRVMVQRAQSYLVKYGHLLVEDGLLAP